MLLKRLANEVCGLVIVKCEKIGNACIDLRRHE